MHISFATTGLHGVCNGSKNGMEDRGGINAPTHAPKFPSLVWDWEGAQKCFILHDQTTGDLKSHHLQARATPTAMPVPPRPPFFLKKGNPLSTYNLGSITQYRIYWQYHIMR